MNEKVLELVQSSVDSGTTIVDGNMNDAFEKMEDAMNEGLEQLEATEAPFISNISAQMKQAADKGFDTRKCVSDDMSEFASISTDSSIKIQRCALQNTSIIYRSRNQTIQELFGQFDKAAELQADLAKCGSGLEAFACYAGVMAKGAGYLATIPNDVAETVSNFNDRAAAVQADTQACIDRESKLASDKFVDMSNSITQCMQAFRA